eukprot:CAMPEP_0206438576 /NCGR_PEP_ID=MMETSP0324_2-20121206/11715_1 /ASSEMBLY_ACC=CAM_ASM_000836 /TAXON_ID=2866 /ORGANISM="Crypthecodinium cohnii, Strain Seligo" /LENGTH=51 /DNA_ID=CAMNT_0053906067 /DNA_START=66 /DNA_END=218 /DNA_ORIENTATION=-
MPRWHEGNVEFFIERPPTRLMPPPSFLYTWTYAWGPADGIPIPGPRQNIRP